MSVYTDKLVNRITPDQQITNLITYKDDITEAQKAIIAETMGLLVASGSNGTDGGTLNDFIDATYGAFTEGDAQRWIRIYGSSNGNDGWYYIDTYVSATAVTLDPALTASETGLTWDLHSEPNLQDDINVAITQLREIVDPSSDWFQNMPRSFDPSDTDVASVKNEKMNLKVLADNWYGSKTKIVPQLMDNDGDVYPVDTGDTDVLLQTTIGYAAAADRRGLCIFASAGNTYFDEGGIDEVCKVDVIDKTTGDEFFGSNGSVVYGKLVDGADSTYAAAYGKNLNLAGLDASNYNVKIDVDDAGAVEVDVTGDAGVGGSYSLATVVSNINAALAGTPASDVSGQLVIKGSSEVELQVPSGNDATLELFGVTEGSTYTYTNSGETTDVQVKFYDASGAYTWVAADPTEIYFLIPRRYRRIELTEYDERRQWVGRVLGDAEIAQDIAEIRDALGIIDGESSGDWDWTNTTAYYLLDADPATAEDAINDINDGVGNRDYTAENYVNDGETITASIDALDQAIASAGIKSKIIERVSSNIQKGTTHTIPFASGSTPAITTYKLDTNYFGLYMDIYVGGVKLVPDSSGSAMDGEYEETSNTQVTFRFNVRKGQIVEYLIRDDA